MRQIILVLTLFAIAGLGFTQNSHYISYGTSDGLPQSQIRAIAQDDRGYLWLGTLGGLSRFDGVEFKNYSTADGLPDNQINCLYQGEKEFWIGSAGALCFVDGLGFHSIPLPFGYEHSKILTLAETFPGIIWIGTAGEGVLRYDGDEFMPFRKSEGLPDDYIRKIAVASDGAVWVGTRSGMAIIDEETVTAHPFETLRTASISDILFTKNEDVIVGTFEEGIYIIQNGHLRQQTEEDGLVSNSIRCIIQINDEEFWLGSVAGINKLSGHKLALVQTSEKLPYSNIKCFGTDREGLLWFGTDGQGVFRSAGKSFRNFSSRDGLCSDVVMQTVSDPFGKLYFGTYDQGICSYNGKDFEPYSNQERLPTKTIWQLAFDELGTLWAGTSQGIFKSDIHGNATIISTEATIGNRVTALTMKDQIVYVGAERGFATLNMDGKIVQTYVDSDGFSGKRIRSIVHQGDSTWIGAEGKVYLLVADEFQMFSIPNDAAVYCLEIDGEGHLWIGSSEGLYHLRKGENDPSLIVLSSKFSSNHTNFLRLLHDESLIIGTNDGLYRLNLSKYYSTGKLITKHYSSYEGLQSKETNQNAVHFDGRYVWFGTTMGVVRFDPDADNFIGVKAPEVNITHLELFLQPTDWNLFADSMAKESGLPYMPVLKHYQNYITFNYSGIYFSNPDKVRYMYMLEGADDTWLGPTKSRSATYAYLPHGQYIFKVKSYSEDEPELTQIEEFSFEITPPYFLTWWFFSLCFLFLLTLLYLFYLNRKKKERIKSEGLMLKYQSRLLELESQSLNSSMNRHFIFNALNSIQYYINMQDRKSANKYLTSFARLIRKNLDSSQQNQTSLSEELERLELYLSLEQMRFQGRFSYEFKIEPGIDPEFISLPAMMLQPFLENSIWHGILPDERHGEIILSVCDSGDSYSLQIDDNGIGINESLGRKILDADGHNSKGMQITHSRVALYRRMTGLKYEVIGPSQLYDYDGNILGTRVTIKLPKMPETTESSTFLHDSVGI